MLLRTLGTTPPHLDGILRLGSSGDLLGSLKWICNEIPPEYLQNTFNMSPTCCLTAVLALLGGPFGNGSPIMMSTLRFWVDVMTMFGYLESLCGSLKGSV